jgi:Tfp pilus assembly protein PilV
MMRATPYSERGVSLVEAMVALAVMAFGMLTVVGVQSTLRLNGDIAKQRSEATRLGQERMEELRAFLTTDATPDVQSWANIIAAAPETVDRTADGYNAVYRVQREVITNPLSPDPPAKTLRITVSWTDRAGQPQGLTLSSVISSAAPALSGTLAVRPGTAAVGPVRRPLNRHPTIPAQARDFGGTSGFVPPQRSGYGWTTVFVFNNMTGFITGVCNFNFDVSNDTLTSSSVASCSNNTTGQLLSGFVRFQRSTGGPALTAADVEDPAGPALNMRMRIGLTSLNPSAPICFDDANSDSVAFGSLSFVTYFCVVYSNAALTWSGLTEIEPRGFGDDSWDISNDSGGPGPNNRYRVCRYTRASNDAQTVPNEDHPRNYTDVAGNLTNQNFVVISSSKQCPTDVAANPANGDFINSNTLQHQPALAP